VAFSSSNLAAMITTVRGVAKVLDNLH
jgi:hypothetical protein